MSKRFWLAALLAVGSLASVAGVAVAAPNQDPALDPPNPPGPRGGPGRGLNRPHHILGEIIEIGENEFTIEGRTGAEITVEVTELTSYLGALESFDDLEVGMIIGVAGHRSGEGSLVARAIASENDIPLGTRMGGEVTSVGNSSLTIENRRGMTFTFNVTAETEFLSRENEVDGLEDIEVGDHVLVLFEQIDDGTLTAKVIAVGPGLQTGGSASSAG